LGREEGLKTYKNVVTFFPAEAIVTEQKKILER
jgi:hypothetical protein